MVFREQQGQGRWEEQWEVGGFHFDHSHQECYRIDCVVASQAPGRILMSLQEVMGVEAYGHSSGTHSKVSNYLATALVQQRVPCIGWWNLPIHFAVSPDVGKGT
jgi:hypothetical protein